jgi:hypothetical protein
LVGSGCTYNPPRLPAAPSRVAERLLSRGDGPLGLQVAQMGLLRHPDSARLKSARSRALAMLVERYSAVDPFRFIVYSQWAATPVRPVGGSGGESR